MFDKDAINARLKKSLQGSVPKLKCIVTGIERVTSMDYLKTKEAKFGTIKNFVENYICREAVKLLKQNMSVVEIKNILNPSNEFIPDEIHIYEAKKYYDL